MNEGEDLNSNPDAKGSEILGMQMQGDTLRRLSAGASSDEQTAILNDIIDRLNEVLKVQVYSDDTSKRYIQGYAKDRWPDGDFGIAISKEGDDVLKADFNDLIFAWDFTTNKQYIRGGQQTYYDKDSGKEALKIGEMADKNMAFKAFDTNGVPMGIFGQSPADRKGGVWTVGSGKNVDDKLKGN